MSNPPRAAGDHGSNGEDGSKGEVEKTMAKTAGFVVFSGIAISILKALNPFNNGNQSSSSSCSSTTTKMEALSESTRAEETLPKPPTPPCCRSSQRPPLQEQLVQIPVTTSVEVTVKEAVEGNVVESCVKAVEIVKGDTLWGLSRKYGVSIEAIKEANGLTSDTIYAGKKLNIP